MESKDLRYRTNWNAPGHRVSTEAERHLLRNRQAAADDQGSRRDVRGDQSADLTKNEKDKQGLNGGPITAENVGAEFYGTILTITASPHEYGTLWVGSDDGLDPRHTRRW